MRHTVLTVAVALAIAGCMKKASYLPNDQGGYTLMTQAESMDQAFTRFQRTAADLCGDQRYALSEPVVTNRGWSFGNGWGGMSGGTTVTAQSTLTCRAR